MILGLTGYARSGKDTVANILVENYGFTRVAFADPIRELLMEMNPILSSGHHLSSMINDYGWEITKSQSEVRRLLQELGVGARKILGDDVWINAALRKMQVDTDSVTIDTDYVITDVRFTNEADTIKKFNGMLWRVKRIGVEAVNGHVSENDMDGYSVDQILTNNGTIEDLEALIKQRMELV